jgi:hypothetical protein
VAVIPYGPGPRGTALTWIAPLALGYLLITLLAFVNPLISLAGFAAYAVYWALPVSGPVSPSEG